MVTNEIREIRKGSVEEQMGRIKPIPKGMIDENASMGAVAMKPEFQAAIKEHIEVSCGLPRSMTNVVLDGIKILSRPAFANIEDTFIAKPTTSVLVLGSMRREIAKDEAYLSKYKGFDGHDNVLTKVFNALFVDPELSSPQTTVNVDKLRIGEVAI